MSTIKVIEKVKYQFMLIDRLQTTIDEKNINQLSTHCLKNSKVACLAECCHSCIGDLTIGCLPFKAQNITVLESSYEHEFTLNN